MSNDNRNMILAVVLSALVLFGWAGVSNYLYPPEPAAQNAANAAAPANQTQALGQPQGQPAGQPAASAGTPARTNRPVAAVIAEGQARRIPIRTPRLEGSINLVGARVDDLVLTQHREGLDSSTPPVRLFAPFGSADAQGRPIDYYATFSWSGPGDDARPRADTIWTASGGEALTPETPITLTWVNGRGQLYRILLRVDDGYLFTAEQTIVNAGQPIGVSANAIINRYGTGLDQGNWQTHVGPVGVFGGVADYDTDYTTLDDPASHNVTHQTRGGWIGFTDKYWLAAVVPTQGANVGAVFRKIGEHNYQADFSSAERVLGTNQQFTNTSYLFAGAKEIHYLNRYTDELGTDMGRAIDWGWFDFIMKPIFGLLTWLFSLIGNFGVAIICLTIIVRILLFPLAQKQFSSMAKMKVLQPKMKALQERYKEDKPRLQQEMMKMYKEEQVNPMAGCLPIFLQIPVFYALFKVLLVSVEMRHQPFFGWIHDLTAPDPLTPVNLFGLLPFTPPGLLLIGVLPILVGVTMWLQQKMNTAPMDPMQQKIFAWMPWILVVIMAPFAAGFQVYWVTNNLISIIQIWFLNRKMGITSTPPATAPAGPAPTEPSEPAVSRQVSRAANKARPRAPRKK